MNLAISILKDTCAHSKLQRLTDRVAALSEDVQGDRIGCISLGQLRCRSTSRGTSIIGIVRFKPVHGSFLQSVIILNDLLDERENRSVVGGACGGCGGSARLGQRAAKGSRGRDSCSRRSSRTESAGSCLRQGRVCTDGDRRRSGCGDGAHAGAGRAVAPAAFTARLARLADIAQRSYGALLRCVFATDCSFRVTIAVTARLVGCKMKPTGMQALGRVNSPACSILTCDGFQSPWLQGTDRNLGWRASKSALKVDADLAGLALHPAGA